MWLTTKILWFAYIVLNIWIITIARLWNEHLTIYALLVHILGLLIIYLYSEIVNNLVKNVYLRTGFASFIAFLYYLAARYHYRVRTNFDYAVFIENFHEMFSKESVNVVFDTLRTKDILNAVGLGIIMLLIQWKWRSFSSNKGHVNYKKGLRKIVILFFVIAMSPYT